MELMPAKAWVSVKVIRAQWRNSVHKSGSKQPVSDALNSSALKTRRNLQTVLSPIALSDKTNSSEAKHFRFAHDSWHGKCTNQNISQ
eukprot:1593900-Alexandrium_andersonii.AAC.1